MPGGAGRYEFWIQLWDDGSVQVGRSQGSLPATSIVGFSDHEIGGVRYRVYQLQSGPRTIQVAQDLDARDGHARALAWRAVWPVAALAPLLMLLAWFVVDRALAPVQRIRDQVGARRAGELHPLPERGLPRPR